MRPQKCEFVMPPDDPLRTRDLFLIATLILVAIFAFGAVALAVGKAKPVFDAPPISARPKLDAQAAKQWA